MVPSAVVVEPRSTVPGEPEYYTLHVPDPNRAGALQDICLRRGQFVTMCVNGMILLCYVDRDGCIGQEIMQRDSVKYAHLSQTMDESGKRITDLFFRYGRP